MLDSFIKGITETREDIEIEKVYIYDLKASGCKSCYGCRIKMLDPGQCIVKDGAYELLREIKNCDGVVISSPIYFDPRSAYGHLDFAGSRKDLHR